MADDHPVFLPLHDQIFGDFEDLVAVAHRSDDGDLIAHDVDEMDWHGFVVHGDHPKPDAWHGCCQRSVDHRGRTRGVEIDVGARLAGKHRVARAASFEQTLHDVLVGGVDHRRAESDRACAEHDDLVGGSGAQRFTPWRRTATGSLSAATSNGMCSGATSRRILTSTSEGPAVGTGTSTTVASPGAVTIATLNGPAPGCSRRSRPRCRA
ncbi:hypothetical protein ACVWWN_003282 [Mycobacterium sp. URHB0021]